MITTIIFDFYGVFQTDAYEQWLMSNHLTRTGDYLDLVQRLDRGQLSQNEFIQQLDIKLQRRVDYSEVYGAYPLDQSLVAIVQSLHTNYQLGLLSNASTQLRGKLDDNDLTKLFNAITISSEVNIAKPNPQIFTITLEKLKATAEDCLYIDDNLSYIQVARGLGLRAIHYTSAANLKQELLSFGITI